MRESNVVRERRVRVMMKVVLGRRIWLAGIESGVSGHDAALVVVAGGSDRVVMVRTAGFAR